MKRRTEVLSLGKTEIEWLQTSDHVASGPDRCRRDMTGSLVGCDWLGLKDKGTVYSHTK